MSELLETAAVDEPRLDLTAALAGRVASLRLAQVPPAVRVVAKQCLLDWLGVTLAASREPLIELLIADASEEGPVGGGWTLIGRAERAAPLQAVLINGAMGHALDYDDVIDVVGHPTAPVAPVALGLAESMGLSGAEALEAFIAGFETECHVGRFMGISHQQRGWHGTATLGAFGSAAAASKLSELGELQIAHAFGLAGVQAAGLKCVFGAMAKPFQVGKAVQSGLLAARLARRGVTSCADILGAEQGFGDTQSSAPDLAGGLADPPGGFYLPGTLFKRHAACFMTHSGIEAAATLVREEGVNAQEIEAVTLSVTPSHLRVCNIAEPSTGLECKFSLRMTTALALAGEDTGSEALFTDAVARRPDLVRLRDRVSVNAGSKGLEARVEVRLRDGRQFARTADNSQPERDLELQQDRLERKFHRLADEVVGEERAGAIVDMVAGLESQPTISGLMSLLRPS